MATTNAALETLIDTVYDSVDGYRKAAETATTPKLKTILGQQADKRQKTLDTLNAELQRVGGDLVTKGTAAGGLHKLWMSITDLFEKGDEAAVERVEEGEDYLVKKFEAALEAGTIDAGSRPVVEAALAEIRAGERLTDQLEAQYDD
ncbi:PA2169 family four-helix-bundle protein [Altererythrobacter aquiaggeris]|uniref:ferritin-like domain-containing protein n=1 Tax=Aestuarierythrobacter aquiaggeris TaxID=1898396 RepID=UPI0030171EB7